MMKILDQVKKTLETKKVKYLIGNNNNSNILCVPYRGIKNNNNHIVIYMEINEELQLISFTFFEKVTDKIALSSVKTKLLDINASLNYGNLGMKKDSNNVEFKVDYPLNNFDFTFDEYTLYIIRCINVYEILKENKLI